MDADTDTGFLPVLPPLALQVVGSFLPPRSIASCRLVCQQWRSAFAASVEAIHVQVHLDPAATDADIAAAAVAFPAATRAVLRLPNWVHLLCNVYDNAGNFVGAQALGRRSLAANQIRRAALPDTPKYRASSAAVNSATPAPAPQPGSVEDAAARTRAVPMPDAGRTACAAALTSLRRHLPGLRALQLGDAARPSPRPGPQAAVQHCLRLCLEDGDGDGLGGSDGASAGAANGRARYGAGNDCATTAERPTATCAGMWGYPATLVPPEGAVDWCSLLAAAVQGMEEHDVAMAHRDALDLAPLALAPAAPEPGGSGAPASGDSAAMPEAAATVAALTALASLDLRCAVDMGRLVGTAGTAASVDPRRDGGAAAAGGDGGGLAAQLTALTVLQLRDGGQLAALRQLSRLASLDIWCCDGCSRTDMSYWTSAAPQRIRRGLAPLAASLTGLTALTLRELAAQVEPPPPVASLAASLPSLRSLTLELVYGDPWRDLADLAEELEDPDSDPDSVSDSDSGWGSTMATKGEEAESEEEDTVEVDEGESEEAQGFHGMGALRTTRALPSRASSPRLTHVRKVVGNCWRRLRHSHPLDLFSCFTGCGAAGGSGPRVSGEAAAAAVGGAASSGAVALTHGSLAHLDVTFLGAGLLPGVWHGISQLGPSLTSLALRVARNLEEERLVARLQARAPGRWPPGSFTIPSLEPFPRLRHLLLDVPLEPSLAAILTAHALRSAPTPSTPLEPPSPQQQGTLEPQPSSSSAAVPPLLESLTLAGMWAAGAGAPAAGASTSGSAASASGAALAPATPLPLRASTLTPYTAALRRLQLDGDLRHLAPDLAAGALRCARCVLELRLTHRPVGRDATDEVSCCDGSGRGMLPLDWTQLPPVLESLELERFKVEGGGGGCDDTAEGPDGCGTVDLPSALLPASQCLSNLQRLRLRHCVAALDALHGSPLAEVVVLASWLQVPPAEAAPTGAGGVADSEATEAMALAVPPWDAPRQLQLLCRQPWAPRLHGLELQLIRPPTGAATTPIDSAQSEPGPQCTSCLSSLEHLAINWELAALSPPRRRRAPAPPPPLLWGRRLPTVGLPPGLAAQWISALPVAGQQRLRSLELWLGDEAAPSPLAVEDICAPWLLRLGSLGRLRLVLCVSTDRGDADVDDAGAAAAAVAVACVAAVGGGGGGFACGPAGWGASGTGGGGGGRGVPGGSAAAASDPLVAVGSVHSAVAHLMMECLPHCQVQVVQVRLA